MPDCSPAPRTSFFITVRLRRKAPGVDVYQAGKIEVEGPVDPAGFNEIEIPIIYTRMISSCCGVTTLKG